MRRIITGIALVMLSAMVLGSVGCGGKAAATAAVATAQPMPDQVKALAENAGAKKDELTASWTAMSTELSQAVAAVQTAVDKLAKSKELPAALQAS